MKKPIYIRDGRRFKRVEDHVGDFWTKDGLWQKERDINCVGQCVKQDDEKYTIAMFTLIKATWNKAPEKIKKLVHKDARVPSIGELVELSPKISGNQSFIWSSTESKCYGNAWTLRCFTGGIYGCSKPTSYYVLSFVDVYYE